jgi:hypothetical protein
MTKKLVINDWYLEEANRLLDILKIGKLYCYKPNATTSANSPWNPLNPDGLPTLGIIYYPVGQEILLLVRFVEKNSWINRSYPMFLHNGQLFYISVIHQSMLERISA